MWAVFISLSFKEAMYLMDIKIFKLVEKQITMNSSFITRNGYDYMRSVCFAKQPVNVSLFIIQSSFYK